jgi:hypothetical protein
MFLQKYVIIVKLFNFICWRLIWYRTDAPKWMLCFVAQHPIKSKILFSKSHNTVTWMSGRMKYTEGELILSGTVVCGSGSLLSSCWSCNITAFWSKGLIGVQKLSRLLSSLTFWYYGNFVAWWVKMRSLFWSTHAFEMHSLRFCTSHMTYC